AAKRAALAAALRARGKDRAENVMIVDPLRNDLSRVCRDGTIEVPSLCRLETLPTVFHLVSTVTGRLRPGLGAVDLLEACFPRGPRPGAPQMPARETTPERQPAPRGPHSRRPGNVGVHGAVGRRTLIRVFEVKDRGVAFQAGGGIVADSDPAAEYDETLAKARALIAALSPAGEGR